MKNNKKSFTVYSAGGLFTQHELTTNVLIKKAVWEQSHEKFELILPQSKEVRDMDQPDIAAHIRNTDLLQVVKADMILARFDGLELDAGTVIEFMVAKFLGKPTLILRCDSRRLGSENMDEPYNLMVKNWPRMVEIHVDSLIAYSRAIHEVRKSKNNEKSIESEIKLELESVQKNIDDLSRRIVEGLEKVLNMPSPYPEHYREEAYKMVRFTPGSGFDQVLTEGAVVEIIQNLKAKGTL